MGDDATEEQMQAGEMGQVKSAEDIDDEDQREVCVVDYFAQHNLEEEPSCDCHQQRICNLHYGELNKDSKRVIFIK
ncbi:MAG: hypothetical protein H0A76_13490 [Candidatus Thiodubiliella endoseptemdiera]|uniref:Uncharacterized protein n=1 Tax=Candidatus Thiodubiliella endoseptemdiera TaxID=2738886 RepID=A0A853F6S7_9GAMM|nr:hypothetical protein [Candidatus Thiodubiliella endoseptemdiera]